MTQPTIHWNEFPKPQVDPMVEVADALRDLAAAVREMGCIGERSAERHAAEDAEARILAYLSAPEDDDAEALEELLALPHCAISIPREPIPANEDCAKIGIFKSVRLRSFAREHGGSRWEFEAEDVNGIGWYLNSEQVLSLGIRADSFQLPEDPNIERVESTPENLERFWEDISFD